MFVSITRQSSRLRHSYVCSSCLERTLGNLELFPLDTPLQSRPPRSTASFSTTAHKLQDDSSAHSAPSEGDSKTETHTPVTVRKHKGKPVRPIKSSTELSVSPEKLKEAISIQSIAQKRLRKSRKQNKNISGEGEQATSPAEAKQSTREVENDIVEEHATTTKSKKNKKNKRHMAKESTNAEEANQEPRILRVKNRLIEYVSRDLQNPEEAQNKVPPSRLHAIYKNLVATKGEKAARKDLVELIQSGGLTTSDRSVVMKELRASLQNLEEKSGPKPSAAQTLASMMASYESVHDAMTSPTVRRTKPRVERVAQKSSPRSKRPAEAKKQIRTGPLQTPRGTGADAFEVKSVEADSLELVPVQKKQPPVPGLSYGLERALFNPGVYHLQDPRSRVFNFDPYLQTIMPVSEFDFTALKQYITSSRDKALIETAIKEKKKYTGSTSSMTSSLAHFHFLLSQWRPINTGMLSQDFPVEFNSFTALQRGPAAIFLRWRDGTYAIDADKQYDNANILSMLGKSMEKLLTVPKEEFEQYRKVNSEQITEDQRNEVESYHYTTMGDFLMRSQLDAHDPRLPGTGMFDLKTRAVITIRMDVQGYEQGSGYEIHGRHGEWESFEREYYDMIRSAFLKYSLQVRMGRMDGIFVAFHNIERIFGFQYISLPEMDNSLHGTNDVTIGDSEFKLSLELLNQALDRATAKFPEKSLRIHFETRGGTETPFMYIFAEPVEEDEIQKIQDTNKAAIEQFETRVLGLHQDKTEDELLEEKKNAEWADLRAKVEDSMENDELDVKSSRAIAENLLATHEVTGLSLEEVEQRVEEFLAASQYNEHDEDEDEDDDEDESRERAMNQDEEGDDNDDDESDGKTMEDDQEDEDEEEDDDDDDDDDDNPETDENEVTAVDEDVEEHDEDIFKETRDGTEPETSQSEFIEEEELLVDPPEEAEEEAQDLKEPETNEPELVEMESLPVDGAEEVSTPQGLQSNDEALATNTDKDNKSFLSATEEEEEEEPKEILAMHLAIRNKVNGKYVVRPEKLTARDKWSVEYALSEIVGAEKSMNLYKSCQTRRRTTLVRSEEKRDDVRNNIFIANLKRLADNGRAWRKKQNEVEKETPVKTLEFREPPKEVGVYDDIQSPQAEHAEEKTE